MISEPRLQTNLPFVRLRSCAGQVLARPGRMHRPRRSRRVPYTSTPARGNHPDRCLTWGDIWGGCTGCTTPTSARPQHWPWHRPCGNGWHWVAYTPSRAKAAASGSGVEARVKLFLFAKDFLRRINKKRQKKKHSETAARAHCARGTALPPSSPLLFRVTQYIRRPARALPAAQAFAHLSRAMTS